MKIGITGATGLIGRTLGKLALAHGHEVIAFTRNPARTSLEWAAEVRPVDTAASMPLDASGLDALVHLAGEPVLGRWSEAKKQRIRDSRVEFTQKVTRCLAAASPRPAVLLSGSAVGYYGDGGDAVLPETAAAGEGLLAKVCVEWEAAARRAQQLGVRVVLLRTGLVLAKEGGAFKLMRRVFSACVGGRLGSGNQWMPWIHVQDEARMILWAAEQPQVSGPLNVVAPGAVTNREFTRVLAGALHRPAFMHAPAFALRFLLGEAAAMLLEGQRAVPQAALGGGFQFDYASLDEALQALVTGGV